MPRIYIARPWSVVSGTQLSVSTGSLGQPPVNACVSDHVGVVFVVEDRCFSTDPGTIVSRVENVCTAKCVSPTLGQSPFTFGFDIKGDYKTKPIPTQS